MTDAEKAYQYFVIAVPENEEQAKAYFWARKALQPTLTSPNEPLTPEMLKEMVQEAGKPVVVWTVNIEDDGSLDTDSGEWEMFDGVDFSAPNTLDDLSHYGQRGYFVAYRCPPEGATDA